MFCFQLEITVIETLIKYYKSISNNNEMFIQYFSYKI